MHEHRELVASFEFMGNDVWFVDQAWQTGEDAVEVIRCEDCTWYAHLRMMCRKHDFTILDGNGFCAWGERKDS